MFVALYIYIHIYTITNENRKGYFKTLMLIRNKIMSIIFSTKKKHNNISYVKNKELLDCLKFIFVIFIYD